MYFTSGGDQSWGRWNSRGRGSVWVLEQEEPLGVLRLYLLLQGEGNRGWKKQRTCLGQRHQPAVRLGQDAASPRSPLQPVPSPPPTPPHTQWLIRGEQSQAPGWMDEAGILMGGAWWLHFPGGWEGLPVVSAPC